MLNRIIGSIRLMVRSFLFNQLPLYLLPLYHIVGTGVAGDLRGLALPEGTVCVCRNMLTEHIYGTERRLGTLLPKAVSPNNGQGNGDYRGDNTTMDAWILAWSNQRLIHPLLDVSMISLTTVGFALLPLFGVMLLARANGRHAGRAMLAAQLVALLFTFAFYYLAMRPRPDGIRLLLAMPPLPSYPSGHAAIAFATATVWSLARRARLHTLGAFGVALLIGYSRIYLGHHYPSDIIGGAMLGMGLGAAVYGIFVKVDGTRADRLRWMLWLQIGVVLVVTQMAYLGYLPMYILRLQYADKVLHFLLFGAITFWLTLWFQDSGIKAGRVTIPLAILLPFSVAAAEEGFQLLSVRRNGDVADLASDLLGMLVLYGVARFLIRRSANRSPPTHPRHASGLTTFAPTDGPR